MAVKQFSSPWRCTAHFGIGEYDGYEDSLSLSNHTMTCGYQVCWEFVEAVFTSKQTFSGFCKITQVRYDSYSSSINGFAVNALINWWFAWIPAMSIDFIEQCFNCGNSINAFAVDGTKYEKDKNVVSAFKKRYSRTLINNARANNL